MAVIDIRTFNGLVPKLDARNLPTDAAQEAVNLAQGTTEFLPASAPTQVIANTGTTNPKTIYRLQRKADGSLNTDFTSASTWRIYSQPVSLVRGQNNNDTTERTYLTYDDGSGAPRVIDATGQNRLLGVPKPATAPTVTVSDEWQFTNEQRADAVEAIYDYIGNMARVSFITPVWRGADRPGTSTSGYMDRDTVPGIDPEEAQQLRVFRYTSTGGANNGTLESIYSGSPGAFDWMFSIDGIWKTADGTWPAWSGQAKDHWCIPIHAYGLTYDISTSNLSSALAAMEKAGEAPGTKLLTTDQVNEIVAAVQDVSDQAWAEAAPKVNALKAKHAQVKTLLDGGTAASQVATMQAYYANATIAGEITKAVTAAADAIFAAATEIAKAQVYEEPPP